MNPLFSLMQNKQGNPFFQAMGAYLRGESPEQFLHNLAKTDPRFQNLNLDNLEQTANQLCQMQGKNIEDVKTEVGNMLKLYS